MAENISFGNALTSIYAQKSYNKRLQQQYEDAQKEYERAVAEQAAAREQAMREQEESTNNGGFLGGVGYLFEKVGAGFLSGIEGIWDYGAGGIAKLFGADDWAEEQFANDWVNYNHADEWYNPSDGWQFAGDVAGGIGTSLPAIAGVAAGAAIAYFSGGSLSPLAAGIISGSIAGFGAAGNATKEAYKETGELGFKEFGYGFLSGATEAGIEVATAGMAKGTGRIVSSIAKSTAKETAETVAKTGAKSVIKNLVADFATEAFEEGLAEALDPVYQRLTYNKDAENATPQEIAYAALVGGLSGLVMSGGSAAIGTGVNHASNLIAGNKSIENGTAASILETSRQLAETESKSDTGYASFQTIQKDYAELTESLAKTGGEITTARQKMLLGELKRANTTSILMPFVERSATNILNNAEAVAQRFTEFGMKDASGKALTFTADAIRAGIDTELLTMPATARTKAQNKALIKSIRAALTSNSTLATLAVADATGHITMNTQKIAEAMLNGSNLVDSNTLNYFVENASQTEIAAASADLGIQDWSAITIDDVKLKAGEFTTSERGSEVMKQRARIRAASEVAQENTKALPHILRSNMADGVYRFSSANADVNMAVLKEGGTYHLYDYDSGNISRSLTVQEINKVLRTYWNTQGTAVSAQATRNIVEQNTVDLFEQEKSDLSRQAAEIDSLASQTVPEYKQLSEPNKQAVRMTIRQAQKYGIDSDTYTTMARVAARSGLNVIFNAEKTGAGNALFDGRNTIYVDPNAPAERMRSKLLLHEAGHAIFKSTKAQKLVEQAYKNISPESAARVVEQYTKLYEGKGMDISEYAPIVSEEIAAKGIEDVLGSERAWEYILSEEPTAGEKFLSFFKKAARDYSADEKLSSAARKMLRQYKKMFTEMSARNYGNNAIGMTAGSFTNSEMTGDTDKKTTASSVNTENTHDTERYALKPYSERQKENWKNSKSIVIYESPEQLRTFVKLSRNNGQYNKKIYFGAISTELAQRIYEGTGLNLENYNAALYANEIRKIFKDHGNEETEHLRGQRAITESDFAQIPDVMQNATEIYRSEIDYEGKPAITFVKAEQNSRTTIVAVVSDKHLDLRVQTEYIHPQNKKGTLATPLGEQAPNNTPKASSGTDSTNSISQNPQDVNTETENNSDERLALPETDSNGKKLTAEQREFFAESKILDENGNLLVCYHGTGSDFTVFDMKETGSSNDRTSHLGFWFTPRKSVAENFAEFNSNEYRGLIARVRETYLNITNPKIYAPVDNSAKIAELQTKNESIKEQQKALRAELKEAVGRWNYDMHFDDSEGWMRSGDDVGFRAGVDYYVGVWKMSEDQARKAKDLADKIIENKKAIRRNNTEINRLEDGDSFMQMTDDLDEFMEWINPSHNGERGYGREGFVSTNARAAAEKFRNKLISEGYDGIWIKDTRVDDSGDQIVAFYPEQIKLTDNENPTSDPDIRFALPDDAEYMAAVESGDMKAAGKMVEQAALSWGAYQDENGAKTFYHGTLAKEITEFKEEYIGTRYSYDERGFFFIDRKRIAEDYATSEFDRNKKGTVIPAFLRIGTPFIFDEKYARKNGYGNPFKADDAIGVWDTYQTALLEEADTINADGIIIEDDVGNTMAVVFKAEQIKSAEPVVYDDNGKVIPLSERFKADNKDIRYALPETDSEGNTLSEQQREYFADTKVVDGNGNLLLVYHGTREANFTEFRRNLIYFTDSAEMADSYSPKGERYAGYLNITKPFVVDAGGAKWSGIPVDAETKAFLDKYGSSTFKEAGKWRTTPADIAAAVEEAIDEGSADYDGIIIQNVDDTGSYYKKNDSVIGNDYIAFNSNQFKNADNKAPTADKDIRYALDDPFLDDWDATAEGAENAQSGDFDAEAIVARGLPRSVGEVNLTVGQLRKIIANNTRQKVYSKKSALAVVNRFTGISELSKKTREQIGDAVWQILNESPDVEYRRDVAHTMAEFIVAKIIVDSKTVNPDAMEAQETLTYLRTGIGKLSFSPEDIAEIRHIRDKKGLRQVLGRWGYKGSRKVDGTNGMTSTRRTPMDVFVTDIAREMPAMSHLEEMHPVDAFMEIDSMYEQALANSKDKWISAYWDMPDSEIPAMIKDIEDTLMQAYESEGEQSKFSRYIEENISRYVAKAEYWKSQYEGIKGRDRILGLLMSKAQQMKDLKLGTFANSTQHDSEVFKNSLMKLAKIQFRGNLNVSGTRTILAELRSWYNTENKMLEYQDSKNNGYYEQGIADMLDTLANGTRGFTKEDLSMLYDVMSYFVHFVENWGKVFRNGKWIDAMPEAQRYIDTLHTNEKVKVGLFKKIAGTSYAQTFFDPMTVARRMDMYESGFFTESMEALRDAAVDAQIAEMELRSAYDEFNRKHKNYVQNSSTETVEYRGTKIQKLHLIGLYMTMKRKHAQAGLVLNGYAYWGADGNKVRVNGVVAPDTKLTDAEVEQYAKAEMSAIEKLLTDTDKEYIAILEQAFNVDARKLKADRDMQRLGFTNATNDYYYPIRRGNISKNVDTSDIAGELDRVSSASFNKDTVRGAKQELFIESADVVFNRHIHAVCQYAHLSPAIETYNRLYNLDVSGNPNKPISVRTESENTWDKGNQYFVKMISDIQGIPATSSEGMAALTRIRSGYAKYQLGANPKVWFTQLSSFFASSSILDADSIARGMTVSSKGIDEYCPLAKLRNNDNTAALAQGVLDSGAKRVVKKIDRFSDALMVPIGKMDRFVVRRLFGACQIQVQKNGGAKVGTEANKVEAGKLLRRVILETQQNSIATERSAAMRSGNEIVRTLTMFTSDSMKVIGRVIDSYGELSTLHAKLKMTTDAAARAELKTKIGAARKQFAKSVGALVTSAAFMAAIAQLFRHIYDKDEEEWEDNLLTVAADFGGNLFGGLPIIKDVISRITDGYEIDNFAYSAVNDLLDSVINLASVATDIFGEGSDAYKRNRALRNVAYSVGQLFGIPVRNVYNTLYGLTKRFNPETAYMIDNTFYKKNYQTELAKAIEADDADQIALIMDLLMGERVNGDIDSAVFNELLALSKSGQSVIPRTIPDSLTIGDVEYPLSMTEQAAIKDIYSTSQTSLKALFAKPQYATLTDEQKADAIKYVYSTYYDKALESTLGIDRNNNSLLIADIVGTQNLALLYVNTKGITSDTDKNGNVIDGSKRKKVVAAINALGIGTQKKLLLICAKGYALKDGDIRGISAQKAKRYLLRYILSLKGKTAAEKAAIAEMCGFEVKNGKINTKNL